MRSIGTDQRYDCGPGVKGLPEESRQKGIWQHVADLALDAANGADGGDLSIALRMVLGLEGIACRPK
jgi:hypothetical protein